MALYGVRTHSIYRVRHWNGRFSMLILKKQTNTNQYNICYEYITRRFVFWKLRPRDGRDRRGCPATLLGSEVDAAVARIAGRRKAPGPDGICSGIPAAVHKADPGWLLSILGGCLESGSYPHRRKQGRLALLRKGVKPAGEPTSYRPLCLLNDVDKLLESILVRRLEAHPLLKGGLSRAQFGFGRGRSADDAEIKVRELG